MIGCPNIGYEWYFRPLSIHYLKSCMYASRLIATESSIVLSVSQDNRPNIDENFKNPG